MYGGSSAEGSMISRQNSRTSADFDDFRGQIFTCVAVYKVCYFLRCFDTVFQRPYRYFTIALKVVFSLSNSYKIFTSIYWLWIEICENVVLSKIDITTTTINKKL